MLTLRLARVGKKNYPQYRIVLQQKTMSPHGKNIATVGYYHPMEKKFECNVSKVLEYIKNGAKPSSTVARLLDKQGVEGMKQYIKKVTMRPPRSEEKAAAAAKTAAPAAAPAPEKK